MSFEDNFKDDTLIFEIDFLKHFEEYDLFKMYKKSIKLGDFIQDIIVDLEEDFINDVMLDLEYEDICNFFALIQKIYNNNLSNDVFTVEYDNNFKIFSFNDFTFSHYFFALIYEDKKILKLINNSIKLIDIPITE